jgi:hypothetical protein
MSGPFWCLEESNDANSCDTLEGLKLLRPSGKPVLAHYNTRSAKQGSRAVTHIEQRYTFEAAGGARFDLLGRTSHDGVADRYSLARSYGAILNEASAYKVPAGSVAWLAKYRRDYENRSSRPPRTVLSRPSTHIRPCSTSAARARTSQSPM